MTCAEPIRTTGVRSSAGAVLLLALLLLAPAASATDRGGESDAGDAIAGAGEHALEQWVWPVDRPFRLARPFVAPPHEFAPGHRGIDLEPLGGNALIAPAGGVVAFVGEIAGRGILTIDHGDGLVTTLEPVTTPLAIGHVVVQAEHVADLAVGGHAAPGRVHFGVRLDGEYINPLRLLGGVARAVLLPCCERAQARG